MITIQNGRSQAVTSRLDRIGSLAYDGTGFALTSPLHAGVTRLDQSLRPTETVRTDRQYLCLCYDARERCYWASADGDPLVLYRLDANFRETDSLQLVDSRVQRLCGIGCDPSGGMLLLLYADAVARVDKTSGKCAGVSCPRHSEQNTGILPIGGGYLRSFSEQGRQYIEVQCQGCGAPARLLIPDAFALEGMLLFASRRGQRPGCTVFEVKLLLSRRADGAMNLVQLLVTCCEGESASRPPVTIGLQQSPYAGSSPSVPMPLRPLFSSAPTCPAVASCPSAPTCPCATANETLPPCPSCPIEPPCPSCPIEPPCPSCPIEPPCPICPPEPPCPPYPPYPPCPPEPPCPPVPPFPPCPPAHSCQCGKYEIMHSIALQEAGLAHILNAEGEKLQKVVAESTTVEQLLCVNESVRRTITQITQLEGQLYAKLDSLTHLCNEDGCGQSC